MTYVVPEWHGTLIDRTLSIMTRVRRLQLAAKGRHPKTYRAPLTPRTDAIRAAAEEDMAKMMAAGNAAQKMRTVRRWHISCLSTHTEGVAAKRIRVQE